MIYFVLLVNLLVILILVVKLYFVFVVIGNIEKRFIVFVGLFGILFFICVFKLLEIFFIIILMVLI